MLEKYGSYLVTQTWDKNGYILMVSTLEVLLKTQSIKPSAQVQFIRDALA